MTTVARPPTAPPAAAERRPLPWVTALVSGAAVLLAGVPVSSVVQRLTWFGDALLVVVAVVAMGLALHRAGAAVVALGQVAAVLLVLTARFTSVGIAGVVPGPAAWREFGVLVTGAGDQIAVGVAPVAPTAEILFLVTGAFGLVAVGVYLAAVSASAPAAGGVPLLAMFAVPAALADDLLPWWTLVFAAAGFGVLLLARTGARRELNGGAALVAGSVVVALVIGAGSGFIGTSGRFEGGSGGAGGSIGLSPFTALRGQLTQNSPTELFRVRGLPKPTYLRALTLRDYVPNAGWQATRPDTGPALPGMVLPTPRSTDRPTTIDIDNVGFKDYWLPVYGTPVGITGLPVGQWTYDQRSGTAYTARPRQDGPWQEQTSLAEPTAAQLRSARGRGDPGPEYLNTAGVDPRIAQLAAQTVAGRETAFDRAIALQDFFTGPSSTFRYSLQTAPSGGDDALVEFLTVGRTGYCEQFASAMAVMLRTVGIPARVAVGFTGGVDGGGYRSITTADAHAWVEAWFPGFGWTTFDPTPLTDGRTVTPPYVAEAQAQAGPGGTSAQDDLPDDPQQNAPTTAPAAPTSAAPDAAAPDSNVNSGLPLWPFVVLAVLLLAAGVALVPAGLRYRERRRRLGAVDAGGPDAAGAAWAELLAESQDRGSPTPASDTVRSAARRLVQEHHLDSDAQQALRDLVGAVEASWYGGVQPEPGELAAPVRTVRAAIAAADELTLRERLLPRSLTRFDLLRRKRTKVDTQA